MSVSSRLRLGTESALLAVVCASTGCGAPAPAPGTGGTDIEPEACGRGALVVETDYQSTNVSLLGWDGAVLSASFLSSASEGGGISAPLTLDVDVPTMPQVGAEVVVLDRKPAGVLTWASVQTAAVRTQLSVNVADFDANPQDYAEVRPGVAYVTRYDQNLDPAAGGQPFDLGSDVVVVDIAEGTLRDSIDMRPAMVGEDAKFLPRANRIVVVEERAYVLLSAYSASFGESAQSRLVTVDTETDSIVAVTVLEGLHGCAGMALAPDRRRLAVSCSGTFTSDQQSVLAEAGLMVLDLADGLPVERTRVPASDIGEGGLGLKVAFVDADTVAFTVFGNDAVAGVSARDDVLVAVDYESGQRTELLRSAGKSFTLGDVTCAPGCGVCFSADAEREGGVVHRFAVADDGLVTYDRAIRVESTIGLPPRYLGRF